MKKCLDPLFLLKGLIKPEKPSHVTVSLSEKTTFPDLLLETLCFPRLENRKPMKNSPLVKFTKLHFFIIFILVLNK
jgi:hypothetical protein